MDIAFIVLAVVAVAAAGLASQALARRRATNLKLSGGRRSLVMNLFDRR